jgi:hypothetical protein
MVKEPWHGLGGLRASSQAESRVERVGEVGTAILQGGRLSSEEEGGAEDSALDQRAIT